MGEHNRILLGDVRILEPLRYHVVLDLISGARVVITDSGGLQEETTALGIPCLIVRENTERPITIAEGTSRLRLIRTTWCGLRSARGGMARCGDLSAGMASGTKDRSRPGRPSRLTPRG